jgi:hypothetical protein
VAQEILTCARLAQVGGQHESSLSKDSKVEIKEKSIIPGQHHRVKTWKFDITGKQ